MLSSPVSANPHLRSISALLRLCVLCPQPIHPNHPIPSETVLQTIDNGSSKIAAPRPPLHQNANSRSLFSIACEQFCIYGRGGGSAPIFLFPISSFVFRSSLSPLLATLTASSILRFPQPLCFPLLRKLPGCHFAQADPASFILSHLTYPMPSFSSLFPSFSAKKATRSFPEWNESVAPLHGVPSQDPRGLSPSAGGATPYNSRTSPRVTIPKSLCTSARPTTGSTSVCAFPMRSSARFNE